MMSGTGRGLLIPGFLALLVLPAAATVSVDFDDGTMGSLNANVAVSKQSCTLGVMNTAHGLPGADNHLYVTWAYGAPGQDRAAIDTSTSFSNVVVSDVFGLYSTDPLQGSGGGVVAGMPADGGSGYLCYLTRNFGYDVPPATNAGGIFWDANAAAFADYELVLVRKNAGTDWPLSAGNVWSAIKVTGVADDTANFIRLTVNGTQVTGEVWVGQDSAVGLPTATVSLTDTAPLSGYAGVYMATRNSQAPYTANWGVTSVDNFTATAVPEPASLLLAALGLMGWRRLRRN